jgi:hypothetical protein
MQPVVVACGELLFNELGLPRAWPDEADIAAQHVEKLRQLVEVPGLENSPAGPREVSR